MLCTDSVFAILTVSNSDYIVNAGVLDGEILDVRVLRQISNKGGGGDLRFSEPIFRDVAAVGDKLTAVMGGTAFVVVFHLERAVGSNALDNLSKIAVLHQATAVDDDDSPAHRLHHRKTERRKLSQKW